MKRIGIYGGSFDPVHKDHIAICEFFAKTMQLDFVYVVPAKLSPFKNGVFANSEHRYKMVCLACENYEKLIPEPFEINSNGTNYSYLTVEYLKRRHPDDSLFFLIGADSLKDFPTWKNPQEILSRATLCVAGREGCNLGEDVSCFQKQFGYFPQILNIEGSCSSTVIREYLMLNLDAREFLDEKVYDYIKANSLYPADEIHTFLQENSTKSRLIHTVGVAVTAKEYAQRLGVDKSKAFLAGMLHDSAKYLKSEDYPDCNIPKNAPNSIVHQFLGAYIAQNKFGITDEQVLNAIKWHTTGRPNMGLLERIVFLADLLEPSRTFPDVEMLRAAVNADFEKGFRLCLAELVKFLKKGDKPVYPLTEETLKYYIDN